ncbi:MAG: hypothetical protein V9H69_17770 [Anaerolineae bacterium]
MSLYVDGGAGIPTAEALAVGWSSPQLAMEVTYQFIPTETDEENQWNLVTIARRLRGQASGHATAVSQSYQGHHPHRAASGSHRRQAGASAASRAQL